MDLSNVTNTVGTIQVISIINCIYVLSDILFAENFLNECDKNKPILVLNASHNYLSGETVKENNLQSRKTHLTEEIFKGRYPCVLKETENPDSNIVDIILNKINQFVVSEEYIPPENESIPNALQKYVAFPGSEHDHEHITTDSPFTELQAWVISPESDVSRSNIFTEAVNLAIEKNIPKERAIEELIKYDFPMEGNNEIEFVKEWTASSDLKIPAWSEQYKIQQPELFHKLKYFDLMDKDEILIEEATRKIDVLYPVQKYTGLREELPVDVVLSDYKIRKANTLVRFEDYYALRYYGGEGYKLMGTDSDVSRRMKNAINRLAIRQSEEPCEIRNKKYFRGEGRILEDIQKAIDTGRKIGFEFNRFTSISSNRSLSEEYLQRCAAGKIKVMYELSIPNPIISSRVEDLFVKSENETILLPGTKFRIDEVSPPNAIVEVNKTLTIKMTHLVTTSKIEQQKDIMNRIDALVKTETEFYVD